MEFYKSLKVNGFTEEYEDVRLRYTVVLPISTSFHSKTVTLCVGGNLILQLQQ